MAARHLVRVMASNRAVMASSNPDTVSNQVDMASSKEATVNSIPAMVSSNPDMANSKVATEVSSSDRHRASRAIRHRASPATQGSSSSSMVEVRHATKLRHARCDLVAVHEQLTEVELRLLLA